MIHKILSIDDDATFLMSIKKNLELKSYSVDTEQNPNNVINRIKERNYSCVLLDIKMPGIDGVEVLQNIIRDFPNIPVIMISGQSNITKAVDSIKLGAYDFIEKPLDPDRLFIVVQKAIEKANLIFEKEILNKSIMDKNQFVGVSYQTKKLFHEINKVAPTHAKVLIYGESGTGKELIAWALHHNSDRKSKPYIKLNCAAIPSELLESELFGHKRGSFTGANSDRVGKFVAAEGGTLFLDEIGDMELKLQSKLLRVLETNEIEIVGENKPKIVDVRIIAATNKNLEMMIKDGAFREDLYHRINVVKIVIPPLRERREDILPLTYHFIKIFNDLYNKKIVSVSRQAEGVLLNHAWKGNVRELKNFLERLMIFSKNNEIGIEETLNTFEESKEDQSDDEIHSLRTAKNNFEKEHILRELNNNDWKIMETAEALDIDRTNLFRKMKNYGLGR